MGFGCKDGGLESPYHRSTSSFGSFLLAAGSFLKLTDTVTSSAKVELDIIDKTRWSVFIKQSIVVIIHFPLLFHSRSLLILDCFLVWSQCAFVIRSASYISQCPMTAMICRVQSRLFLIDQKWSSIPLCSVSLLRNVIRTRAPNSGCGWEPTIMCQYTAFWLL